MPPHLQVLRPQYRQRLAGPQLLLLPPLVKLPAHPTPETLVTLGMISRSESSRVKLLGKGELAVALKVRVHAASAGAKARIEAAGGSLEIIGAEA